MPHLPRNIQRERQFFELPPPLGINNVRRRQLIDFDECGIAMEKCNRKCGAAYTAIRVRKPGHYTKGLKMTVKLAVEPGDPDLPDNVDGSLANPRRWFIISDDAGTTEEDFAEFVNYVLVACEASNLQVDNARDLLWDNLAAHLRTAVYNTVYVRPSPNLFQFIPRPPYQPKYGPTEYMFAELADRLQQQVQEGWTQAILKNKVRDILSQLGRDGSLDSTFEHCGYMF